MPEDLAPASSPTSSTRSADEIFVVEGMLALNELSQLVGARPARPQVQALQPALPRAHPRARRRLLRGDPPEGHHRPPPLRILRRGGAVPAAGGARPERRRDQADALPHLVELSPIVEALAEAAEAGKSVTALVELKARFDEEANIRWARDLERAGVQVVFGFIELKTHAKLSHGRAARGRPARHLLPCRHRQLPPDHGADLHGPVLLHGRPGDRRATWRAIFNFITGYAEPAELELMAVSPREPAQARSCAHIEEEIAHAKAGRPAAIWVQVQLARRSRRSSTRSTTRARPACRSTSSCAASAACGRASRACPRTSASSRSSGASSSTAASTPSATATACRIPKAHVYISSADLMPRNLDRRVEALLPILNPTVHQQVLDQIMLANLLDNEQSWTVLPTGASRADPRRPRARSPSTRTSYFMTNPSLSGRGKSSEDSRARRPLTPKRGRAADP